MTLQGVAIRQASIDFGNGQTLPFTPCKRGYIPQLVNGERRMYACSFHHMARAKRLVKEKGVFRDGEVDLHMFWNAKEKEESESVKQEEEEKNEETQDNDNTKPETKDVVKKKEE